MNGSARRFGWAQGELSMWFVALFKMKRVLGLAIWVVSIALTGCSLSSREIPFESVSSGDANGWEMQEPSLLIASNETDLKPILAFIPPGELEKLDMASDSEYLATYCLIAVFQGQQGTSEYEIAIQSIRQSSNTVRIHAKFTRPELTDLVEMQVTQPYHLVRVKKTDLSGQGQLTFVLIDDSSGKEVAKEDHVLKYGKLEPELYDRLQVMGDSETIQVGIWLSPVDVEQIRARVAARYPDAKLEGFRPGKGSDLEQYEKIYAEMKEAEKQAYQERELPLIASLEQRGFQVSFASQYAPLIFVELPKNVILELAKRDDIETIYLCKQSEPF